MRYIRVVIKSVTPSQRNSTEFGELLQTRLCDLAVKISGTVVEKAINKVRWELSAKGIVFTPYFWVSTEWFVPDGYTGIAVPFYLLNAKLKTLEKRQTGVVEGANYRDLLKFLRHECGHAVDNAYGLRRRRERQRLFGKSGQPYQPYYEARPYSRKFVRHLENGYAQSHPDEDFAETFAVWLDPGSQWKKCYRSWPVIEKLKYLDRLFATLNGVKPEARSRAFVDPLNRLPMTLRQHYNKRRKYLMIDRAAAMDVELRRIFDEKKPDPSRFSTASSHRPVHQPIDGGNPEVLRSVAKETGLYQYKVKIVLEDMLARCRALRMDIDWRNRKNRQRLSLFLIQQAKRYQEQGLYKEPR